MSDLCDLVQAVDTSGPGCPPALTMQQIQEHKEDGSWAVVGNRVFNVANFFSVSKDFPQDIKLVEGEFSGRSIIEIR